MPSGTVLRIDRNIDTHAGISAGSRVDGSHLGVVAELLAVRSVAIPNPELCPGGKRTPRHVDAFALVLGPLDIPSISLENPRLTFETIAWPRADRIAVKRILA